MLQHPENYQEKWVDTAPATPYQLISNQLKEYMKEKTIYDLEIHESRMVADNTLVIRVPGGWIYRIESIQGVNDTFVPFNNEFMKA